MIVLTARTASASGVDLLNSSNRTTTGDDGRPPHLEVTIVPAAGGTTDIGFGGGFFLGVSKLAPGRQPFVWNFQSAGFITFRDGPLGLEVPYQDIYFKLTIPRFLGPFRLEARAGYSWESTLGYYGIGNASSDALPAGTNATYFEFGRLHPRVGFDLRWALFQHLAGRMGIRYEQNWLQVTPQSKLAEDLRSGSPAVKALLGSVAPHGVAAFVYGVQLDNRDNEVSAHTGMFHEIQVKLSPGGVASLPYRYVQGTAVFRFYVPLWKPRLTLAARLVGDVIVGDPPFYDLARFDDAYAIGGNTGVRGVPGQRYYGKVKVLGNVELRAEIFDFRLFKRQFVIGLVGFFDGGRVWSDLEPHPELDGSAVGLKYGAGGGLRIKVGDTFILRGDVAWSPDAKPVAGYIETGHMF